MPTYDLVIKGGSVATPGGIAVGDVAVKDDEFEVTLPAVLTRLKVVSKTT